MSMDDRPAGAVKMTGTKVNDKLELFSQNLTWLLRAKKNSKHYADFMAVDITGKNTAVLKISGKRYPFDFTSESDILAQVVDILGGEELPASEK